MIRPCRVCGNKNIGQLSKHHLIPRQTVKDMRIIYPPGRVKTIKLCQGKDGCRSHLLFHKGDKRVAKKIRSSLEPSEIQWMVELIGSDWVRKVYPPK